jgi:peptidoglycan DL-endopeptidase CwlO
LNGSADGIRPRRGQALYVLLVTFAALLAASQALAAQSPSLSGAQAQALQVESEINALDASLDRSDELVNLANLRLVQVRQDIAVNRRELVVARHNLAASRKTIARRLVTMYTTGSTSTLDVILGAQTLDEVLSRIDDANRISSVDLQVAAQVVEFKSAVLHHRAQLAVARTRVQQLVARRASERQAIEIRLGERRRLLSSVDSEVQRLIAAEQERELAAGRAAQQKAAAAQVEQATSYADTAVGVTAQSAEGAAVLPPSSYGGVAGVAMQELGVPYQWAGSSPGSGFDCSGLVMWAYSQVGVSLPHSSYAMWNQGVSVPRDQLQPGDIVFFDGLGHVGIYIGGGEFVHAPHTGTVVQVSSLDEGSYAGSYDGARRIS